MTEDAEPECYLPFGQAQVGELAFALRVSGDAENYSNSAASVVASIDRNLPIYHVQTYDDSLNQIVAQSRFQTLLFSIFAGIALLLAAIGLYAVLSYMVTQRTLEIGLRIAVGAQRGDVLQLVLRRGLGLGLIGIGVGLAAAAGLTSLLAHMLYGIKPLDSLTFIAVSAILLAVSIFASLFPAWRAARLDPIETLRTQ